MTEFAIPDRRQVVVSVCDSLPPYRVRVHRRIIAETPAVRFHTLCTHDPRAGGSWEAVAQLVVPHESFGDGESPLSRGKLSTHFREWRKGGRIIRWLREHGPSAVIVNGYNDPGRLRILLWCRMHGVPVFCWGDSNIRNDQATGIKALAKRLLVGGVVQLCFGVFPFGSLGAAYFRKYGARPSRIFLMPMEPDYERIESISPEEIEVVRARYRLASDRKRILYCGRLAPEKRVDLAIGAFAAIAADRPDWDLLIAGEGPLRDSLALLVPAPLAHRVIWTGGIHDSQQVFAVYAACDVLILPSDHEPWALVVNEAAASGLAIVCTDVVGASPELVHEGVNGSLAPRGDAEALAACLRRVTDPAQVDKMKRASREVLRAWRETGDPVAGFHRAMRACGVL